MDNTVSGMIHVYGIQLYSIYIIIKFSGLCYYSICSKGVIDLLLCVTSLPDPHPVCVCAHACVHAHVSSALGLNTGLCA